MCDIKDVCKESQEKYTIDGYLLFNINNIKSFIH